MYYNNKRWKKLLKIKKYFEGNLIHYLPKCNLFTKAEDISPNMPPSPVGERRCLSRHLKVEPREGGF